MTDRPRRKPTAAANTKDLADRTEFVLDDEHWTAFQAVLDRRARPMPGLAAFLARRSVLDKPEESPGDPEVSGG